MHPGVIRINAQSGFTLLEIMVVITIIALMATTVLLTVGDNVPDASPYRTQKAQLSAKLRALAQSAQLQQQWRGLYFEDNSYQPMLFSSGKWQKIPDAEAVEISSKQSYLLLIDNEIVDTRNLEQEAQPSVNSPQILVSPAGLFNHFEVRFGDDQSSDEVLRDPYAES